MADKAEIKVEKVVVYDKKLEAMVKSTARATVKPDKISQGNIDDTVGAVAEMEVKGIMKSLKAIK